MIEFNREDYRTEAFEKRVKAEAKLIHGKESTRNGRELEEVENDVRVGHFAEWFLLQHEGWQDNEETFNDVIDPDGNWIEVKVTKIPQYVPSVVQRLNERHRTLIKWEKPTPDAAVIFINDHENDSPHYRLHSYYVWNGFNYTEKKNVHLRGTVI